MCACTVKDEAVKKSMEKIWIYTNLFCKETSFFLTTLKSLWFVVKQITCNAKVIVWFFKKMVDDRNLQKNTK